MKSGDLQKAFGIGATTIKNWCDEFAEYLSDGARAMDSRHRRFTESDYIALATVAELSQKQKLPYQAIHEKLQGGYRVENPGAWTIGYEDGRMVPAAAVEQIIDASEIRVELEIIRAERDRLANMLSDSIEKASTLEDKNEQLTKRLIELERELGALQRELGRAETEAKILREQQDKKRGWFGRG